MFICQTLKLGVTATLHASLQEMVHCQYNPQHLYSVKVVNIFSAVYVSLIDVSWSIRLSNVPQSHLYLIFITRYACACQDSPQRGSRPPTSNVISIKSRHHEICFCCATL
jgi:hypothetical protein